jgi:hypothetical protein
MKDPCKCRAYVDDGVQDIIAGGLNQTDDHTQAHQHTHTRTNAPCGTFP